MHELSIAQALIGQVRQAVDLPGARRVVSVRIAVGALSGVDPEALRLAFPLAAEGTLLDGARLDLETVAAVVCCRACQASAVPESPFVYCPVCGSQEVTIKAGRELDLKAVEIETTEPPGAEPEGGMDTEASRG